MTPSSLSAAISLLTLYERHWRYFLALALGFSLAIYLFCGVPALYFQDEISFLPAIILVALLGLCALACFQILVADCVGNASLAANFSPRLILALRRYFVPVILALLLNLVCLGLSVGLLAILAIFAWPVLALFICSCFIIGFIVVLGELRPLAAIKRVVQIGIKYWHLLLQFSLLLFSLLVLAIIFAGSNQVDVNILVWPGIFIYGLTAPYLAWLVLIELNSESAVKSELEPAVNPVS